MAKAVEGVEAFISTLPGDDRQKLEVITELWEEEQLSK